MPQLPQDLHSSDTVQIGDEIQVKWSTDNEYHPGIVTEKLQSGHYTIAYEEDELVEDLTLEREQWCFKYSSCERAVPPKSVRSPEASTRNPQEVFEPVQENDDSEEYEPQTDTDSPVRRRRGRPRRKSQSSESADAPRRSSRLYTRRYESSASVRRSRRLSSRNANKFSKEMMPKGIVSTPDARVQGSKINSSKPAVSSIEKSRSLPRPAQTCGVPSAANPPSQVISPANPDDMTMDPRVDRKFSREVLNTSLSIKPQPEGRFSETKDQEQCFSCAPKSPRINLDCSSIPTKAMTTAVNLSSTISNYLGPNASFPSNALQSATNVQLPSEHKERERKLGSGSDAQPALPSVDSDTRQNLNVLDKIRSSTKTGTQVSSRMKKCNSRNAGPVKGGSSTPVTTIQKKTSVRNPSSPLGQDVDRVISRDWSDTIADIPVPRKPKRILTSCSATENTHRSNVSRTSHGLSNKHIESNLMTDSHRPNSTNGNEAPCNPPTQDHADQGPMDSLQLPRRQSSSLGANNSGLGSPDTSGLRSVQKNGTGSTKLGTLQLGRAIQSGPRKSDDQQEVNCHAEKQISKTEQTHTELEQMEVDGNFNGRRKRCAPEALVTGNEKHRKPNSSTPFSTNTNTEGDGPNSRMPQNGDDINTLADKEDVGNGKHKVSRNGDALRPTVPVAGLQSLSKAVPGPSSDNPEKSTATPSPTTQKQLETDNEILVTSRSCELLRSDNNVKENRLGVTEKISKNPSHASRRYPPLLGQANETPVCDKRVVSIEAGPASPTSTQQRCTFQKGGAGRIPASADSPQVQTASRIVSKKKTPSKQAISMETRPIELRSNLQTSAIQKHTNNRTEGAELFHTNVGSTPVQIAPENPTRNEMRTTPSITVEKRRTHGVIAKLPFFPEIVRLEKEAADIDMNLRCLSGQSERRNKAIDSLQNQLEDMRKKIARIPTSKEVKRLMESRKEDMKKMLEDAVESAADSFRTEMRALMSREVKSILEATASEIHRGSAHMLSRAVQMELSSQDLETSQPNNSPSENCKEAEHKHD